MPKKTYTITITKNVPQNTYTLKIVDPENNNLTSCSFGDNLNGLINYINRLLERIKEEF